MEKNLIYSFRSEGTALPKYSFCKVYKDGKVEFGSGWLIDHNHDFVATGQISKQDVHRIEETIDKYSELFSVKKVEEEYMITDGSYETIFFSDGQRSNTLRTYSLWAWNDSEDRYTDEHYPKTLILLKFYKEVRDILLFAGLAEDYC